MMCPNETAPESPYRDPTLDRLLCAAAGFAVGILLTLWVVAW